MEKFITHLNAQFKTIFENITTKTMGFGKLKKRDIFNLFILPIILLNGFVCWILNDQIIHLSNLHHIGPLFLYLLNYQIMDYQTWISKAINLSISNYGKKYNFFKTCGWCVWNKKFLHRTGTFIAFLKLAADISNNQVGTYILFLTTF